MNLHSNNMLLFTPDIPMFLQNCQAFTGRFPELSALLGFDSDQAAQDRLNALPPAYRLIQTKAGGAENQPTLLLDKSYLHSKYNPQEEAHRILASDFFHQEAALQSCIFAGLGLGYLPVQYAKEHPAAHIVIIEPDIQTFLCFLLAGPRTAFFRHERLTMLLGLLPEQASSFLVSAGLVGRSLFKHTVSVEIHKDWFDTFFTLHKRILTKNGINAKTLERFGSLWLKNTAKNLPFLYTTAKIGCFQNSFTDIPAIVLAGGPSLTRHIQLLKKTHQNFLIIAVDTALRACVHEKITPDFLLSFDPQYWNYLHTAGFDTSKSILISEAAAFPAVLRQQYRAIFLSHSSVPFAQFLEQTTDENNTLAAGGSVATTAWDFARFIGANPIIMAGLDLAFPNKQTHFTGSTFEEAAHSVSSRVHPAEQSSYCALHAAFPQPHRDYSGGTVITDRRMLMYAWWFESTLLKYPAVKTYNLEPRGILIPGMSACTENSLYQLTAQGMARVEIHRRLSDIINKVYSEVFVHGEAQRKKQLLTSIYAVQESATELMQQAQQAEYLCQLLSEDYASCTTEGKHIPPSKSKIIEQLTHIDKAIRTGFAKNLVEVLFFSAESNKSHSGTSQEEHGESTVNARKVYQRIKETAQQVYEVLKAYPIDDEQASYNQ